MWVPKPGDLLVPIPILVSGCLEEFILTLDEIIAGKIIGKTLLAFARIFVNGNLAILQLDRTVCRCKTY
jgi:hypothetical protein